MKWEEFARPSVAVDVAVLTVVPEARPWLGLLVYQRAGHAYPGRWDIPGGFVRAGERLAETVLRVLREKSDVQGLAPTQLHVFDDPKRDERGWVIAVAQMDAVPHQRLQAAMTRRDDVRIVRVQDSDGRVRVQLPGRFRRLPWDHDEIVTMAVERLRERYARRPDPDGLTLSSDVGMTTTTHPPNVPTLDRGTLMGDSEVDALVAGAETGPSFTLTELRRVHEAVAGRPLQRDTFRRMVEPRLQRTAFTSEGRVGRPGVLYVRDDR